MSSKIKMAMFQELNIFYLRVELCESVFAVNRLQPGLVLEASHHAGIF